MRVLAFSDLHTPFMKRGFILWARDIADWYEAERIVIAGDLVDGHTLGRWPKHPDAVNVGDEVKRAREQIAEIVDAFPKVDFIFGNHDDRLKKRMYELGVPDEFIPSVRDLYQIPETWDIHPDSCTIDDVFYYHGHKKGGMDPAYNLAKMLGKSVVCGHFHSIGGITRQNPNGNPLFGMNLGCGVDISSYGMYYAKETLTQPVLGLGTVTDGVYPHHYIMGE